MVTSQQSDLQPEPGDNRPPVYYEDGNLIIRASAIGTSCLWELVAAGQGYDPATLPKVLVRAFEEGHAWEPLIITRLEIQCGFNFFTQQVEGELILPNNVMIRYHPDGIAGVGFPESMGGVGPRSVVVEIKALSNGLWQRAVKNGIGSIIDEYPWQLSVMMHAELKPGVWVAYNKGNAPDENGYREPCDDEGKLQVQYVSEAPIPLSEIAAKAQAIKELVDGEDILASGRECDSPDHWPCRYLHLRPEGNNKQVAEEVVLVVGADDSQADYIDGLVREYVTFKGQYDEAETRYRNARDTLLEIAGDKKKIQTDKWLVGIVEAKGRESLDWSSMPEELKAELKGYMKPGKSFRYIRQPKRLD